MSLYILPVFIMKIWLYFISFKIVRLNYGYNYLILLGVTMGKGGNHCQIPVSTLYIFCIKLQILKHYHKIKHLYTLRSFVHLVVLIL
jgi:hypothetical protein